MSDFSSLVPSGLTPSLALATGDRYLGWALTMTAVAVFLLRGTPRPVRLALGAAVFFISIVPATWGLSHWLGLAYQTPSLVTQGLALLYLYRVITSSEIVVHGKGTIEARWPISVLMVGFVLGWVLVLDTFALFPVPLYAFGYSIEGAMFGLAAGVALWGMSMRSLNGAHEGRHSRELALILVLAVAIHAFTRLPSGNAWDAMFDPWLWLVAQGALVVRIVRFRRQDTVTEKVGQESAKPTAQAQ